MGKITFVVIVICYLLAGYVEGMAAGQTCNYQSDCGYNEYCKQLKYKDRSDQYQTGICVPKEW